MIAFDVRHGNIKESHFLLAENILDQKGSAAKRVVSQPGHTKSFDPVIMDFNNSEWVVAVGLNRYMRS